MLEVLEPSSAAFHVFDEEIEGPATTPDGSLVERTEADDTMSPHVSVDPMPARDIPDDRRRSIGYVYPTQDADSSIICVWAMENWQGAS